MIRFLTVIFLVLTVSACAALKDGSVSGRDGKEPAFKGPSRDLYEVPRDPISRF